MIIGSGIPGCSTARCEARVFHLHRAQPAGFRPAIALQGEETRALAKQPTVVAPQRLGRSVGGLDAVELRALDEALLLAYGM